MRYLLEQSDETLTTHSGLALVGLLLSKTELEKKLSRKPLPDRTAPTISHFDIIASYIGLLCQGKSDFDHIVPFRQDPFFSQALMINTVLSSPHYGKGWTWVPKPAGPSWLLSNLFHY